MGNNLYGYQCLPASRGWPAELRILVTGGPRGYREQRIYVALPFEVWDSMCGSSRSRARGQGILSWFRCIRGGHGKKEGDK